MREGRASCIRESNRRAKGMKGVARIKSARSTVGRKEKGWRISLPLGRPTTRRHSRFGNASSRRWYERIAEREREREKEVCVFSPSGTSLILGRVRSRNQLFNKWNPAPPTATWNYFGCGSVLNYTRLIVIRADEISDFQFVDDSGRPSLRKTRDTTYIWRYIQRVERIRIREPSTRISSYFGYFESCLD